MIAHRGMALNASSVITPIGGSRRKWTSKAQGDNRGNLGADSHPAQRAAWLAVVLSCIGRGGRKTGVWLRGYL